MRQNSWSISFERQITGTPCSAFRWRMGLRHTFQQMAFVIALFLLIPNVPVSSLTVHQPPALTVMAGDTAVMECKFDNEIMWSAKAFWTRNSTGKTPVELDNPQYSERLTKSNLSQTTDGKTTMNISDVRVSDSDIYYCKIEMADENTNSFKKGKGTGTNLTVLEGQKGRKNQSEDIAASGETSGLLYGFLTVLAVIILALVITAILYQWKESSRPQLDAQGATPMMAETEESLHYAEINLRNMDCTVQLKNNTLYAPLNLRANVHTTDTEKDNIHYAQQNQR